ncbi:MAG: DUF502 domain-containing protein [Candidatus Omnitrophica bacterium]|nr:DUF502 domain-containing protein [Candidatus Omnitrophota bacterium]
MPDLPKPSAPNPGPSASFSRRVGLAIRRYFITGLATLFPVAVTAWVVKIIFRFSDQFLGQYLPYAIPGLGLLVTLLIILLVGVLSVHVVGRVIFHTLEAWLVRLPIIKKIYPAAKQLAQFLFKEEGKGQAAFRHVVLVEWPRLGSFSIAFVTNETTTSVTGAPETLVTVLIPTPPSPVTGPIIFLREKDVIPLTMSVEDAMKLILSGGVVAPPLESSRKSAP